MKTKFQLISLGALALLAVLPVARAAETNPPPPAQEQPQRMQQMREQRMKQLDEKLHLTAEQKAKITAIWDKAAEEGRAARQEANALKREQRKERREVMKASRQDIRGVLTPEQQKIFDEMPRPKPERRDGRPDGGA